MKRANTINMFFLATLLVFAACGKKNASGGKKSSSIYNPINTTLPVSQTLPQVQAMIAAKTVTDGFTAFGSQNFAFMDVTVSTSNWWIFNYSTTTRVCTEYAVVANPTAGNLAYRTRIDNDCNGTTNPYSLPATYTLASSGALQDFMALQPIDVQYVRNALVNGSQGYIIYTFTGVQLVIAPSLPLIKNPVAIYDSNSGDLNTLYGINVIPQ